MLSQEAMALGKDEGAGNRLTFLSVDDVLFKHSAHGTDLADGDPVGMFGQRLQRCGVVLDADVADRALAGGLAKEISIVLGNAHLDRLVGPPPCRSILGGFLGGSR